MAENSLEKVDGSRSVGQGFVNVRNLEEALVQGCFEGPLRKIGVYRLRIRDARSWWVASRGERGLDVDIT